MYNLKGFRKEVGISQNDLAVLLKCGQSNISAMEKTNRDLDSLQEMALKKQYGEAIVEKYRIEPQEEDSIIVSSPLFPTVTELLSIIKSQQETIRTLSDTLQVLNKGNINNQ